MYNEKQALSVGAVVIGSLVVLALLLIRVGNLENYLTDRRQVEVVFADGKGLPTGAPVLYQGIQIGTVEAVDVLPASAPVGAGDGTSIAPADGRNWVLVTLDVEASDKFPLSYADEINVQVPLAMGDPDLRITPMPAGTPYDGTGNPIVGGSGGDILTAVNSAMDEIGTALGEVFGQAEREKLKSAIGKAEGLIESASKSVKTIDETVPTVALAVTRVMGRMEATVGQLDADLKEIAVSAKQATDKLGVTIENLDGVVTTAGPKLNKSLDKADAVLSSGQELVKTLETEAKGVSGEAKATLSEAKGTFGEATAMVKESRAPLRQTLTDVSRAAADSRATLAAATEAVVTLRDVLAENREKLRLAVSRVEQISGNLRGMTAEVRRQPWRLIRKPSKSEVKAVELATASDQAAVTAEELAESIARLEAMLKSKEALVDSQLQAIDSAASALQETLQQVDELEEKIEEER